MDKRLFFQAIAKFLLGFIMVGLLIFIPAGTIKYWNGWLFMGLLFIPMFVAGIFLLLKNPNLLRRRLDVKEKEQEQKEVLIYSGIMFLTGFITAGLSYRYAFGQLPDIVVIISSILFVIAYVLYAEVLRENSYLSRTIKVEKQQEVVDTGFYRIVRHPMYSITIFLFLMIPLILGSLPSFIIFLIYPFILIKRIKNEEAVLEKELKGYSEYKKIVKYRLIPFIW